MQVAEITLTQRAKALLFILFSLLPPLPLAAHELWLQAQEYMVAPESRLVIDIVNGQKFRGHALPYLPNSTILLAEVVDGGITDLAPRPGDRPALDMMSGPEGLRVVVYQSTIATLTYREFEKFLGFVAHKDLPTSRAGHLARGLPETDFKESYARFSKALIAVGNGAGADQRLGLETELVALANPYTDALANGLPVQLFYQNTPRVDAQIEIFEKNPDGEVYISTVRTDGEGIAMIPVLPGNTYMLDADVLREPDQELAAKTGAVWESLWANLTFALPETRPGAD